MRNKRKIKSLLKRKPQRLNNSDTNEALIVFQGLLDSHSVSFKTNKQTGTSEVKNQFYKLNKQKRRQFVTEFINNNFTTEQVKKLREINSSGNNANLQALGIKTRIVIDEIKNDKRSKKATAQYHYGNKRYGTYKEGDSLDVQNLIQKREPLPKAQRVNTGLVGAMPTGLIGKKSYTALRFYTRDSLEQLVREVVPNVTLEQAPAALMEKIKNGVNKGELNGEQVVALIDLRDKVQEFLRTEQIMLRQKAQGFHNEMQVQMYRIAQTDNVNAGNVLGDALMGIDESLIAYSDQFEDYKKHEIKTINPLLKELEKNKL